MPNQIRIEGNLGKDSELRHFPNGNAVLNFRVAAHQQSRRNDQGGWDETGPTLWFDGELWGDEAEPLSRKMQRGSRIIAFGHLKCETWNDKQTGEQQFKTKLVADAVKVLPPRNQQGGFAQQGKQPAQQGFGSQPQGGGFGDDDQAPPF